MARWEDAQFAKGLVPRDLKAQPLGSLKFAPRPGFRLIPRSAWRTMIEDKTAVKTWLSDKYPVPKWSQGESEASAAYAVAAAAMLARAAAGHTQVELMPESLADSKAVSCVEVLEKLATTGIEDEAGHAYTMKVMDLSCASFDEIVTCALRNVPMVFADAGWNHAVCGGLQLRATKGLVEVLAVSSFGPEWGEDGCLWIEERGLRMPTEAYAVVAP